MIASTTARAGRSEMSSMNGIVDLQQATGTKQAAQDEMPVPKSSMAIRTPSRRSTVEVRPDLLVVARSRLR